MKSNRQWRVRKHVDAGDVVSEDHFELTEFPIPDIVPVGDALDRLCPDGIDVFFDRDL